MQEQWALGKLTSEEVRAAAVLIPLLDSGMRPRTILEVLSRLAPPSPAEAAQAALRLPATGGPAGPSGSEMTGFCYPCGPDMVIERCYMTGLVIQLAWACVPMELTPSNVAAISRVRNDYDDGLLGVVAG